MTHVDGESSRRIRIRVIGDDAQNLAALHRWLSLEDWFSRAEAEQQLRVVYREDDGEERDPQEDRDGPPMSGGLAELVLVIASAAITPVFQDLYNRAKVAARAWADNTSSDDNPVLTVVRTDGATDDAPDTGTGTDASADAGTADPAEDDEGGRNT
jgi:hypothetical protein